MEKITISTTIQAPIETVWACWTQPEHITGWAFASDDWECPSAKQDVREGGEFTTTMAAKDGSVSFDIVGTYSVVEPHKRLVYTMEDDRVVDTAFSEEGGTVKVVQTFDAESENPAEMQRQGWQAILDNFKKYTEAQ